MGKEKRTNTIRIGIRPMCLRGATQGPPSIYKTLLIWR